MKKSIAIVVAASIYNQKGLFNAVHARITHLKKVAEYDIDAYMISMYKPSCISRLLKEPSLERPSVFEKDGVKYKILWIKNTLFDFVLVHKFNHCRWASYKQFNKEYLGLFSNYDLIEGHACGFYIYNIWKRYKTPYIMTWHGTDIHTTPFLSRYNFYKTAAIINDASHNFFVSKALLETSNSIVETNSKSILYNGMDERFKCYTIEKKKELRKKYGAENKVIAFVGNLIPVKNAELLPSIFSHIAESQPNVKFWVVGAGPLSDSIKEQTRKLPITFWGDVDHSKMPDIMNVIDVLVLPSKNEGLPLVTVEALSCGCNVIGSRIGGIPESIGEENTIILDDQQFALKFAMKCVEILINPITQKLSEHFNWSKSADKENEVIRTILK